MWQLNCESYVSGRCGYRPWNGCFTDILFLFLFFFGHVDFNHSARTPKLELLSRQWLVGVFVLKGVHGLVPIGSCHFQSLIRSHEVQIVSARSLIACGFSTRFVFPSYIFRLTFSPCFPICGPFIKTTRRNLFLRRLP